MHQEFIHLFHHKTLVGFQMSSHLPRLRCLSGYSMRDQYDTSKTQRVAMHTQLFAPITLEDLIADGVPDVPQCFSHDYPRSIDDLKPHILDIMYALTLRKGAALLSTTASGAMIATQATRKWTKVPTTLQLRVDDQLPNAGIRLATRHDCIYDGYGRQAAIGQGRIPALWSEMLSRRVGGIHRSRESTTHECEPRH
jgi:hypothetical protein